MPCYDYECQACGVMELTHGMKDPRPTVCPQCGKPGLEKLILMPAVRPPADSGWQLENGGKGRYFPQMGRKSDPKSYFRDLNSAKEAVSKRGQKFERD